MTLIKIESNLPGYMDQEKHHRLVEQYKENSRALRKVPEKGIDFRSFCHRYRRIHEISTEYRKLTA